MISGGGASAWSRTRGRQEGRQEGRREQSCDVVRRLLTRRFGPLDTATLARIERARIEDLDAWIDRFATAETLAEVLGDS